MTQRNASLSRIREGKSTRIIATCKLTQISWRFSWYARVVPQTSLKAQMLGGQAKTIMRTRGEPALIKKDGRCAARK